MIKTIKCKNIILKFGFFQKSMYICIVVWDKNKYINYLKKVEKIFGNVKNCLYICKEFLKGLWHIWDWNNGEVAEWSIAFVLKTNGRDERSRGSNPFLSANIIYMETILCGYCGKPLERKNAKFCSSKCSEAKKHELSYKDFLENNDKYCRGNYTPKQYFCK